MHFLIAILSFFCVSIASTDSSMDMVYSENIAKYLEESNVKNGYVLVSDLKTGQVKAVVEVNDYNTSYSPNKIFESKYPAASLAKIITTIAAINNESRYIYKEIPQSGSIYGINPKQYRPYIGSKAKKSKRTVNLEYAFSHSVNPAMAIVGYDVGATALYEAANLLGFNREFKNTNAASIYTNPSYKEIARHSSGYTTKTTISVYHANMIARSLGNNGHLKELSFIKSIEYPDENLILQGSKLELMRSYMRGTTKYGTGRSFNKILGKYVDSLDIGGKTGNLSDSRGIKHTWFTGYAKDSNGNGIAVTTLILNQWNTKTTASKVSAYSVLDWFYGI